MIEIKCAYTKLMPVAELKGLFNAFNANEHPEDQIVELVEQFKFQGIRHPAILSRRTGKIIAGHGRVLAADRSNLEAFPVDEQAFASEAEEYAFLVADNEIQRWSVLNLKKIHLDLPNIEPFPIERLAIRGFEFEPAPIEATPEETPEEKESRLEREYEGLEFATKGENLSFRIHHGDCLKTLKTLQTNSLDSMVTDPPAGISFMGKAWDGDKGGRDEWVKWLSSVMSEAMRVLKPGAHALVWALPRTSHWTATALEDAGFEIRDVVTHLFGSGFPKSHDISKAIDRAAGKEDERPKTIPNPSLRPNAYVGANGWETPMRPEYKTSGATPEAIKWQGFGTALKPASENWILCRKPIEGTIAENVLKWGVGGLNIDGSRIAFGTDKVDLHAIAQWERQKKSGVKIFNQEGGAILQNPDLIAPPRRFPANLVLSHNPGCADECEVDCAVAMLDAQSGGLRRPGNKKLTDGAGIWGGARDVRFRGSIGSEDVAGASRFFYVAKPAVSERNAGLGKEFEDQFKPTMNDGIGAREHDPNDPNDPRAYSKNFHPTVKPIRLMRYLIKLITPPNGTVLDPFTGSGTTGIAALAENMHFIGCEQEKQFVSIATARIASAFPKAEIR